MNEEPVVPTEFRGPRELSFFQFQGSTFVLADILSLLEAVDCMNQPGSVTLAEIEVTTERITLRLPDQTALVTTIENAGDVSARIYEAGVIVLVLGAGETKPLPERGRLLIEADTFDGTTTLRIAVSKRESCGDIPTYVPDPEPIGAFLL